MKLHSKILLFLLGSLTGMSGCKKNDPNDIEIHPLISLTITNAISGGKAVRINNNVVDSCLLNNYKIVSLKAASATQVLAFPNGSPNTPYYNKTLDTKGGEIYSLYLTGTHAAPESVFVKDNIPPFPPADVINVRVVNLSPNAGPLNITLASASATNIFSGIGYKQVADFITLPLPTTVPTGANVFQVRDAANNLLLSYTLPATGTVSVLTSRHRNITLAIRGRVGGTGTDALAVLGVPHY